MPDTGDLGSASDARPATPEELAETVHRIKEFGRGEFIRADPATEDRTYADQGPRGMETRMRVRWSRPVSTSTRPP